MTPGTVAVTADEAGRFTRFAICMQSLVLPPGSRTLWQVGNDIAGSRNRACEDMEGDWIWFVDDDHVFRPDLVSILLRHDVDIVAPVVLRRQQPFLPVACLDDEVLDLKDHPAEGLLEVDHTGSSGMLIRRRVIEELAPSPWFELGNGISEDVNFCRAARAAGFSVHVDLGARMGHITPAVIWPVHDEANGWLTGFSVADGFEVVLDIAVESAVGSSA